MELVTTMEATPGFDIRLADFVNRSGRSNTSNAQIVFEILRAAKGQGAPIVKVIRHECRHDEGQNNCTLATRVEA